MNIIKKTFASEAWQKLHDLNLPQERILGGVCSGLGKATPFAPWMWRVLFMVTTCTWGVGILAYLTLMIAVPDEE